MRSQIFFAGLIASVSALGIQDDDVSPACSAICRPLVQLSNICTNDIGATDASCICDNDSFDVKNLGSMCAICQEQTNNVTPDLSSISAACSFTQGSYQQVSAASVASTVVVTATQPGSNEATTMSAPSGSATTAQESSAPRSSLSGSETGGSSGNFAAPTMAPARWIAGAAGMAAAGLVL